MWRVGHKVPRNLYRDDEPIAMLSTPEIASNLARHLNEQELFRLWLKKIKHVIETTEDDAEDLFLAIPDMVDRALAGESPDVD